MSREQHRRMLNVRDRGAGICSITTVDRARRSGIGRQRHVSGAFQPIAAQSENNLRMPFQPAHVCLDRDPGGSGRNRRSQQRANAVDLIVATFNGADVIRLGTVIAFGSFQARRRFRAFRRPARRIGFETGICDQVLIHRRHPHFNVVHETFARAHQQDL